MKKRDGKRYNMTILLTLSFFPSELFTSALHRSKLSLDLHVSSLKLLNSGLQHSYPLGGIQIRVCRVQFIISKDMTKICMNNPTNDKAYVSLNFMILLLKYKTGTH